jgi:hypothetical protein
MDHTMGPAVLAAIIPTPVALIAAAAAYATGRVQGRAAYLGPVDAVRRQHQRDAYASLLAAANNYASQTEIGLCLDSARAELGIQAVFGEKSLREEINRRAARIRASVPVEPVRAAAAVVSPESPKHIADPAEAVAFHVDQNRRQPVGTSLLELITRGEPLPSTSPARAQLLGAIDEFTTAARSHLNGHTTRAN